MDLGPNYGFSGQGIGLGKVVRPTLALSKRKGGLMVASESRVSLGQCPHEHPRQVPDQTDLVPQEANCVLLAWDLFVAVLRVTVSGSPDRSSANLAMS